MKAAHTLIALVAFFSATVLAAPIENSIFSPRTPEPQSCLFCDVFGICPPGCDEEDD
ncbi:hypothetical protein D9756_006320 [Leucocoprinus leucothites]|uniref:Uncharacterized protein n=1 Tax=Leucocoprinus leucothites TaxID=201217 RepID=A0A8H5D543_9AGAR|nr:hypothetical protein D9756_006320 [Leucoagaricus leucothites]